MFAKALVNSYSSQGVKELTESEVYKVLPSPYNKDVLVVSPTDAGYDKGFASGIFQIVDDLPEVPDHVVYHACCTSDTLQVEQYPDGSIYLSVGEKSGFPLDPDDVLQLAHDLLRMGLKGKKLEENVYASYCNE